MHAMASLAVILAIALSLCQPAYAHASETTMPVTIVKGYEETVEPDEEPSGQDGDLAQMGDESMALAAATAAVGAAMIIVGLFAIGRRKGDKR